MAERAVYVIAEAGVNHDGELARALELAEAAAESGADAVKYQAFRSSAVARADASKAAYQTRAGGERETQRELLARLELGREEMEAVRDHCRTIGIDFLATPFDLESLRMLVGLDVPALKISSGDVTNEPLLAAAGETGLPLFLSTGMATLEEVEWALGTVASTRPGEPAAGPAGLEGVTLLHCTSQYPAPIEDVNLRAMTTLHRAFGLPVGYSDHTVGSTVPLAAVALGAEVVEKHMTLDRGLPGPDHAASMEPASFREMVAAIRDVERALGSGRKVPAPSELENRITVRRSLVAARPIRAGDTFTEENLDVRRPGDGISARRYREYIGRTARRDYEADEPIRE